MRVDSYEIYDNLNLIEDSVRVKITNALFTSTRANWTENDSKASSFILNKPTTTSAFENNGSGKGSRYAELTDLVGSNNVNDIRIKFPSKAFVSILKDKVADIDLTGLVDGETIRQDTGKFVTSSMKDTIGVITPADVRNKVGKEFKTGSTSVYKVLSDNNYSDAEKTKLSNIISTGDGTKALLDNGTYGAINTVQKVNGIGPVNYNITITTNDINYGSETLKAILDKTVLFNSSTDKSITLGGSNGIYGTNTSGKVIPLIKISTNTFELGSQEADLRILSNTRPSVRVGSGSSVQDHNLAYESDLSVKLDKKPDGTNLLIGENNKISETYMPDTLNYDVLIETQIAVENTTVVMKPNTYHVVDGTPNRINLTFENIRRNIADVYYVEFLTTGTPAVDYITLPSNVMVANGFDITALKANTTYVCEIRNNIAKFTYAE